MGPLPMQLTPDDRPPEPPPPQRNGDFYRNGARPFDQRARGPVVPDEGLGGVVSPVRAKAPRESSPMPATRLPGPGGGRNGIKQAAELPTASFAYSKVPSRPEGDASFWARPPSPPAQRPSVEVAAWVPHGVASPAGAAAPGDGRPMSPPRARTASSTTADAVSVFAASSEQSAGTSFEAAPGAPTPNRGGSAYSVLGAPGLALPRPLLPAASSGPTVAALSQLPPPAGLGNALAPPVPMQPPRGSSLTTSAGGGSAFTPAVSASMASRSWSSDAFSNGGGVRVPVPQQLRSNNSEWSMGSSANPVPVPVPMVGSSPMKAPMYTSFGFMAPPSPLSRQRSISPHPRGFSMEAYAWAAVGQQSWTCGAPVARTISLPNFAPSEASSSSTAPAGAAWWNAPLVQAAGLGPRGMTPQRSMSGDGRVVAPPTRSVSRQSSGFMFAEERHYSRSPSPMPSRCSSPMPQSRFRAVVPSMPGSSVVTTAAPGAPGGSLVTNAAGSSGIYAAAPDGPLAGSNGAYAAATSVPVAPFMASPSMQRSRSTLRETRNLQAVDAYVGPFLVSSPAGFSRGESPQRLGQYPASRSTSPQRGRPPPMPGSPFMGGPGRRNTYADEPANVASMATSALVSAPASIAAPPALPVGATPSVPAAECGTNGACAAPGPCAGYAAQPFPTASAAKVSLGDDMRGVFANGGHADVGAAFASHCPAREGGSRVRERPPARPDPSMGAPPACWDRDRAAPVQDFYQEFYADPRAHA